jgi:hypothetical protein
VSVKGLLDFMRKALKESGRPTEHFDNPDKGTGDLDVVKRLNAELAADPEIELPEGYVRYFESRLEIRYDPPECLSDV